jgi:hypothetical protein
MAILPTLISSQMVNGLCGHRGKPAVNLAAVEPSNACAVVQIQNLRTVARTVKEEDTKLEDVTENLVKLVRLGNTQLFLIHSVPKGCFPTSSHHEILFYLH